MNKILENLNEKQVEAVTHFTGPMLVLAGAGSGKTKALTNRIAWLIQEKSVAPWNILGVTFTNKASEEMKNRVTKLISGERLNYVPTIGTFHSVCVQILRRNVHKIDHENSFVIYDTADQGILMKRVMQDMGFDPKKINPKAVLSHISNAKNQLISPTEYRNYANEHFTEKVANIYPVYQKMLMQNNAMDFDDIIMKTVQLFEKFPEVLEEYQEKYKFILVDEYQDTNRAQYILIKLLAEKYKNICVIGDVDQSIYSWRGATVQNIMDFEKDYPNTKVIILEQNYRSTQIILEGANEIIKKNTKRKEKNLWTNRKGGEKIKHWLADNETHEAQLIAQEIGKNMIGTEYQNYKDFVVLYRTNAQSRVIEESFIKYGIPYKIVGGVRFYERKEIKDIVAYLRVIQNPNDSVSLMRIINNPSRKIGSKTIESVRNFASKNDLSMFKSMLLAGEIGEINQGKSESIDRFIGTIKDLQKLNSQLTASALIKNTIELSGYKKMIDDGSVEGDARMENISELISVAQKYDQLEPGISLNILLEEISLISDIDMVDNSDNAVTLMTVHSAKGLEFPYVFIAGLEDGIFPHSRSLMERDELEEERRLMYVAMTRAMDCLYFLNARSRMLYGEPKVNAPSQFIAEINENLIEANFGTRSIRKHIPIHEMGKRPIPIELEKGVEIALGIGDKIEHTIFGKGILVDVKGGVGIVSFEDPKVGVKKLALSIAPLKKV